MSWRGGNAWRDGGTEGAPIYGVDGEAFYVSAEEPGGKGWYVVGGREDETEPAGPWSDVRWGLEVDLDVDAAGDTGAPGTRHLRFTTTGEGARTIGTVHLGDGGHAAGISVAAPSAGAYLARAIGVGEAWRAVFDARSGMLRGKLFAVAAGEPADWDVGTPLDATEDEGDRFGMWVRCGNGAGSGQTVRIHRLRAMATARPGQHVESEWIGYASGLTDAFATRHPYVPGSLRIGVAGIACKPTSEDGSVARLGFEPTAGAAIRASYITGG